MSARKQTAAEERIVNELDAILPGEIDRRKFLNGAIGTMGAIMLAGCTGGGNGDDGGSGSPEDTEAIFTTPWKIEPSWGHAHVAEGLGYWEAAGVPNLNAQKGNGSDTESQNIGVGNTPMGIASLTTAVNFLPGSEDTDQLNMTMMALARGRPLLSLIWNKDVMSDRTDLEGRTVLLSSGFASASWPVYPQIAGVDASNISTQSATEAVSPAKLASGEVQAVWGSIDLLPDYQAQVDAELGVAPLTAFGPFYGFPLWVNDQWFENKENNVEFMAQVITGYFKAVKWGLLNQSEYLDYLKNEVNTNLQTWTEEELVGQARVNAAQAIRPEMKDEGLGYFTTEGMQFTLESAGPALTDSELRPASELTDTRAFEASEKVTFSDDEWSTLQENAGDTWTLFEEAESEG
ncbi:MAG: ABC transporter substrate-binding protein [Natronomonas sp.]|uniref:ABC transporter substrate-binding protein n=1 Tax=Natronomonas sp. TaxID=2184060 RepID=UPI00286FCA71|nr:ABC transporter substrate-binding protein [Natronomonas sp.]MDR9431597.1 ABC transporter substrate-binding protein [Natronomonas sp.]